MQSAQAPSAQQKQPVVLNGLPLEQLQQIPGALREAPEQALLGFQTRTTWLGGLRSRSAVDGYVAGGQRIERRHAIEADEPVEVLGGDTAPNPQELLFSAIGACLTAVYAVNASLLGIELRSLEVELRGTLDMRGMLRLADVPMGFPEVSCRVFVDADAAPERIRELHDQVLATSPNFYHLTTAIPARTQLVIQG
jgi:uncharacterized OsmC-like protein